MKKLLILTAAALTFAALPAAASAKDRGCEYRLSSLTEAEVAVAQAQGRGIGVAEARAQLARARELANQEGCFVRRSPNLEPIRYDGPRRDHPWHEARSARARFDRLIDVGYRRGLTRDEFRELEQLRKRHGY